MDIDEMFSDFTRKNAEGTLCLIEALIGRYYRIRNGQYAGRVILKTGDKIDGREIIRFANGLTWKWLDTMDGVLCELIHPTFNEPLNKIDYSEATWYNDNGNGPNHHSW